MKDRDGATAVPVHELTGRDLDAKVAEAMGWILTEGLPGLGTPPDGLVSFNFATPIPRFSADDYSGFADVERWLRTNAPTARQVLDITGEHRMAAVVKFIDGGEGYGWWAGYYSTDDDDKDVGIEEHLDPTLPAAACRLLIAWAAVKKERRW